MSFTLPNPNTPQNGQLGDATPILQNEQAIAQAIAAFDGSQINAKSVTETALADAINPRLRALESFSNYVYTGCVWSVVSGLQGSMTGGTIYVNGYRTIVTGVSNNTFAASSDVYVDIDYLGNITYNAVSNNATAPSLTANALRVAKIVTNGSAITTVTQTGADGVGNIIYPVGILSAKQIQNPYKFNVYRNAAFNGTTSTSTLIFDTKVFDTGNNYSTSTGLFTSPVAGYYQFNWMVTSNHASSRWLTLLQDITNNAELARGSDINVLTSGISTSQGSQIIQLSLNQQVAIQLFSDNTNAGQPGLSKTYFSGFIVSAT